MLDNILKYLANAENIFTSSEMSADETYNPEDYMSWWDKNGKAFMEGLRMTLFLIFLVTAVVLTCIPPTSEFGVGMLIAAAKGGISGAVIGGVIGGVISATQGNGFFQGLVEGAVWGFIDGFNTAAVLFCASAAIRGIAGAVNKAKPKAETFYRTMSEADYQTLQQTGKLPVTNETFITKDLAYAKNYDGVTVKFQMKSGTNAKLEIMGVRNAKAVTAYPDMILGGKGWTQNFAYFKAESGLINIGLGKGNALTLFNKNILSFAIA